MCVHARATEMHTRLTSLSRISLLEKVYQSNLARNVRIILHFSFTVLCVEIRELKVPELVELGEKNVVLVRVKRA